jgi:hypothetical protein
MADQTTQPPADAAPLSAEDLEKKKKKAEKAAAKDAKKAKAEAKKQQQQQKQATPNGNTDAAPAEAKVRRHEVLWWKVCFLAESKFSSPLEKGD